MKLLASNVVRASVLAVTAALVSIVASIVGSWALAIGALAVTLLFLGGAVALSHVGAQRATIRAREVQQRDTRALMQTISANGSALSDVSSKIGTGSTGVLAIEALEKEVRASRARAKEIAATPGNFVGRHGAYFGVGPEYEYAERSLQHVGRYETFALRSKSLQMRDVFARAATGMQFNYRDTIRIVHAMRAGRLPGGVSLVKQWNRANLAALARVLANQRLQEGDTHQAVLLFRLLRDVFGIDGLGRSDAYVFTEALTVLGHFGEADKVFRQTKMARRDPTQTKLLRLNSRQSEGMDTPEQREQWVSELNDVFNSENIDPVEIVDSAYGAPLDSLRGTSPARTADGPLVTVLIPTFNGADFLETTLRCMQEQTWKNIEIIVVDDFSDQSQWELLEQICSQFEDVRLIRQASNMGAYLARNAGLKIASGEFVTVHDDDDWSHPQKLQIQVEHLLATPSAAANMTRHARASEDLRLTRINNNPSFSQPNFSSLMFRKELIERIGPWDSVNRGADAEFRDRIVLETGEPIEVLGALPLSFTRTHGASLTAGEIGRGYIDPSRLLYQSAYQAAHIEARESGQIKGLLDGLARPLNMMPGMRGKHLGHFEAVFATDFRFPGGTSALTLNEIDAASARGIRVGLLQLDSPLNTGNNDISPRLLELAQRENVEILSLNDTADVDALVIRHPSVVQYADNLNSKLNVGHAVVIVNNPPILTGGRGVGFVFEDVRRNVSHVFGVTPELVPESGVTRKLALAMTFPEMLAPYDWPGFIDTVRFEPADGERSFERKPVLGRHSRDAALKWPSKASVIEALYRGNDNFDCRILGGVDSLPVQVRETLAKNSDVVPFGAEAPEEFLGTLDFWAYFHSEALTESFGMSTAEAMASGLVVFLPPYMRPNFDDGALYAEPTEVRDMLLDLWEQPEKYREQSKRAREVVVERFSVDAFFDRLGRVVAAGRDRRLAQFGVNDG